MTTISPAESIVLEATNWELSFLGNGSQHKYRLHAGIMNFALEHETLKTYQVVEIVFTDSKVKHYGLLSEQTNWFYTNSNSLEKNASYQIIRLESEASRVAKIKCLGDLKLEYEYVCV